MSMRRPSAPPQEPRAWTAYAIRGAKAAWLGHIEAPDEAGAIAAAAAEYRVPASRIRCGRLWMPERKRPLRRGEIIGQRTDREHRVRDCTGVCSMRREVAG
jgi:hypothetical protein